MAYLKVVVTGDEIIKTKTVKIKTMPMTLRCSRKAEKVQIIMKDMDNHNVGTIK
jgi:hypothetical protein